MNHRLFIISVILILAMSFPGGNTQTAKAAETLSLKVTLERLVNGLNGAFDSGAQLRAEQLSNTPAELQHQRVHRTFTRIDAPDVGQNVFVVTLRNGGPNGPIDMVEFQVWTLTIDTPNNAIKMAPYRFKDPKTYAPIGRDPKKMKGLKASDLIASDGAAGCIIYWRAVDTVARGLSGKPCLGALSPTRPVLSWEWTYILGDTTLWMSFAGRDDNDNIVFGRKDQLPWRLDRVSR
ncbi:MAG: CpcT/CpeT family chromophore lyase [Rhodospirillaceae bacterium]